MTDEKLLYLVNSIAEKNDQVAFAELYRYLFPGLVSFSHSLTKDKTTSIEVVENVFVKLWENRKVLPTIKSLSNYLFVAVKYSSINAVFRRKKIYFEEVGDDFAITKITAEHNLISEDNLRKITDAINSLPPQCRLIFKLVKEEGMRYKEVAQLLELSVKTVETQMYRAIEKITKALHIALPEYSHIFQRKKNPKNL